MTLYICTSFKKIPQRVSELLSGYMLEFNKGHISIKNVDGVMVLFSVHIA